MSRRNRHHREEHAVIPPPAPHDEHIAEELPDEDTDLQAVEPVHEGDDLLPMLSTEAAPRTALEYLRDDLTTRQLELVPGAEALLMAGGPVAREPMQARPPQEPVPAVGVVLPAPAVAAKYRILERVGAKGINMNGHPQFHWEPGQVGVFVAHIVASAPHCFQLIA